MAENENDNSTFFLNLDASDFISNANAAKQSIADMADAESLSGLMEGLEKVAPVLGGIGVAAYALKSTFETVFDAEQIKQTGEQFEILSTQSGVYSDKLKKGLEESTQGWIDETETMNLANQAMVQLQGGAEKLPELMELARKSTIVMGGDLASNFQMMVQAIASGRTETLKMHGLVVDQATVYRDYAASIGTTVGALSQAGKQQAMLNAVLKVGKQQFGSVDDSLREGIDIWTQFKATMKEVGDAFKIAFDKIAGPTVIQSLQGLKDMAKDAKSWFTEYFGSGAEQAAAKADDLAKTAVNLKARILDLEKVSKTTKLSPGDEMLLENYKKQLKDVNAELEKTNQESTKLNDADQKRADIQHKMADATKKVSGTDTIRQAQQEAAAKKELLSLDEKLNKEQIEHATSAKEAERLYNQQLEITRKQYEQEIQDVKAKESARVLTHKQAQDEIVKLNKIKNEAIKRDDDQLRKMQEKALDKYVRDSKNGFQGIARAFEDMSLKNKHAMKDWGDFGNKTAQSFGSHMTDAFKQMGSGAKSATDAISDAFMGMIADVAAQYGEMMMLASIFPPDPATFAAGAALVALSGMLGSMGGGSSSSSFTAGSQGTGISGEPGSLNNPANPTAGTSLASQTGGKSVQLIVQGNVFSNDATNRWLVDQIRQASDATDFTIQKVGGGI